MDEAFFLNSPFIKMMANYPNWTLSNPNKAPLNAKAIIQGNYQSFYSYKNQGLVTLDQIFPFIKPGYRLAFHLDTLKTHMMVFDIEKDRNPSWDQKLKDLPYSYVEQSMHGGIHAFMQITDDKYHSATYREILNANTTELQALEKNSNHKGVEFLFNNHFITFTGNKLPDQNSDYLYFIKKLTYYVQHQTPQTRKEYVELTSQAYTNQTKFFDDVLLPLKKAEKIKPRLGLKDIVTDDDFKMNADDNALSDALYKQLIHDKRDQLNNYYLNYRKSLKAPDADMSTIEYTACCKIYGSLKSYPQWIDWKALQQESGMQPTKLLKEIKRTAVLSSVVVKVARKMMEYRAKWDEYRRGQTYIEDTATQAILYIKAQDEIKAKPDENKVKADDVN